jgi:hypothetical protein
LEEVEVVEIDTVVVEEQEVWLQDRLVQLQEPMRLLSV